jgi:hypothetical protein
MTLQTPPPVLRDIIRAIETRRAVTLAPVHHEA